MIIKFNRKPPFMFVKDLFERMGERENFRTYSNPFMENCMEYAFSISPECFEGNDIKSLTAFFITEWDKNKYKPFSGILCIQTDDEKSYEYEIRSDMVLKHLFSLFHKSN